MNWLKTMLFTVILMAIAQNGHAQQHYNAWFRTTLSMPITSKLKIDLESHYRRQNSFDNTDILDKNLMFMVRNLVHYQYTKDLKLTLSPFAYFTNYKIIQNPSDETAQPIKEVRFTAAMEWQHNIVKNLYFADRGALEYRIFIHSPLDMTRLRNRMSLRNDFNNKIRLTVFDEVFYNVTSTATLDHFFDQNRLGIELEYKIMHSFKVGIGYIYLNRRLLNSNAQLSENNMTLNFNYQWDTFKRKNKS